MYFGCPFVNLSLHVFIFAVPTSPQAEELIHQKTEDIQEKMRLGEPVQGEYLTHLLLGEQMTVDEILGSITELLLAGVDTVRAGWEGWLEEYSQAKLTLDMMNAR